MADCSQRCRSASSLQTCTLLRKKKSRRAHFFAGVQWLVNARSVAIQEVVRINCMVDFVRPLFNICSSSSIIVNYHGFCVSDKTDHRID